MGLPLGDKGYLRVTTPQTENGDRLRHTEDGRVITKETHLPLTARKHLELENEQLPLHLKHKIEIVSDESLVKAKQAEPEVTDPDLEIGDAPRERKKPGPKPKSEVNQ